MTQPLSQPEWGALAAHRLHSRWRSINPRQLDELDLDLWKDEHLRGLEPAQAVDTWLTPILTPDDFKR